MSTSNVRVILWNSYLLSLADYTQKRFFVEKTFVSVTFLEEVLLIDGKIYFTHVKLIPFHVHNQYSGFWKLDLIVEYFYWLLIKKTLYCVLSKQSYYFPSFLDPLLL